MAGPVFDVDKLRWLNGRYIREDYTADALQAKLEEWALNREHIARIVPLVQPRLETLSDWGQLTAPFFADGVPFDPQAVAIAGKSPDEVLAILQLLLWRLEAQHDFTAPALDALLRDTAEKLDLKLRQLLQPLFLILSGRSAWTPLFDSMEILGADLTRMRLRRGIAALGGLSGKRLHEIEKEYARHFGPGE